MVGSLSTTDLRLVVLTNPSQNINIPIMDFLEIVKNDTTYSVPFSVSALYSIIFNISVLTPFNFIDHIHSFHFILCTSLHVTISQFKSHHYQISHPLKLTIISVTEASSCGNVLVH